MRRRKPRVVWLPSTDANSVGQAPHDSVFQNFVVNTPVNGAPGDIAVGEIPLTIDSQDDPLDPNTSLADLESSGYRLRRIVGKIWVELDQAAATAGRVGVTAGLIVRRSDPVTGVSLALTSGVVNLVSPQAIASSGDPWVWRRSWLLFNNLSGLGTGQGPTNNFTFGSGGTYDGPHVDQKTARIISNEERIFLDVSVILLDTGVASLGVTVFTDLRILASMRTSSGNRRNASR